MLLYQLAHVKEERFESFFDIMFYCEHACKLPIVYLRKAKNTILYEVFKTM